VALQKNWAVEYANAGHPAPVRVRRNERSVEQILPDDGKPGPGLGLFDGVNFSTSHSVFEQNDCILLFTDGLYEVESPEGEQFGLDALISSLKSHADLPAEKLFNALLAEACEFSKKQEFDDDVCIVAVEQS